MGKHMRTILLSSLAAEIPTEKVSVDFDEEILTPIRPI